MSSSNIPLLKLREPVPVSNVHCEPSISFGIDAFYKLTITSEPKGATIIIDGHQYGLTPKNLIITNRRTHLNVMLLKDGFVDTALVVDLQGEGTATEIQASLAPLPVDDR